MSQPSSMNRRLTSLPPGPVCRVTSTWPSILRAFSFTSASERHSRTPPAPSGSSAKRPAPRPPAWIWDLTTQTGPFRSRATCSASSGVKATPPRGTATPNFASRPLA